MKPSALDTALELHLQRLLSAEAGTVQIDCEPNPRSSVHSMRTIQTERALSNTRIWELLLQAVPDVAEGSVNMDVYTSVREEGQLYVHVRFSRGKSSSTLCVRGDGAPATKFTAAIINPPKVTD